VWWKARIAVHRWFVRFKVTHGSATARFTSTRAIAFGCWVVWVFVGSQSIVVLTIGTEVVVLLHVPFRSGDGERCRRVSARITSISHLFIG
jgi:hypothetical protein